MLCLSREQNPMLKKAMQSQNCLTIEWGRGPRVVGQTGKLEKSPKERQGQSTKNTPVLSPTKIHSYISLVIRSLTKKLLLHNHMQKHVPWIWEMLQSMQNCWFCLFHRKYFLKKIIGRETGVLALLYAEGGQWVVSIIYFTPLLVQRFWHIHTDVWGSSISYICTSKA